MKFTYDFYNKYTQNVYNGWVDKTFLSLIYLKHYGVISDKSFISLTKSILRGKTPERRGTFYFKEIDKWFNDEFTVDIYHSALCNYSSRRGSIDMEDMIKYVSLITGQPRNYTINTIFDLFVKPLLIYYRNLELDNSSFDTLLYSLFEVNFDLKDKESFIYVYHGDAFEDGYKYYENAMVNHILKTKFHQIAKTYYKGRYYLNPRYTKTENFDYTLNDNEHIFEVLVAWGEKGMDSLIDTQYR